MLGEAEFYRGQAQSCQERLSKVRDPRRRKAIQQELRDWSDLALRAVGMGRPVEPRHLSPRDPD